MKYNFVVIFLLLNFILFFGGCSYIGNTDHNLKENSSNNSLNILKNNLTLVINSTILENQTNNIEKSKLIFNISNELLINSSKSKNLSNKAFNSSILNISKLNSSKIKINLNSSNKNIGILNDSLRNNFRGNSAGSSGSSNSGVGGGDNLSSIPINSSSNSSLVVNSSNLTNFFNEFGVGFGSASSFPFSSNISGSPIWVSSKDLITINNFSSNSYYDSILNYNVSDFNYIHSKLNNSKYLLLFLTKDWQESWFSISEVQNMMNFGIIPVFSYWYFGDSLVNNFPNQTLVNLYYNNSKKFGVYLSNLNGSKFVLMEPEFNKGTVLSSNETMQYFSSIISNSIDIIKNYSSNKTYFSLTMTDSGIRDENNFNTSCGYANCALGDNYTWSKTNIIYSNLSNKLDFISFQEMLSQFSRNPQNPGNLSNPILKIYNSSEIGISKLDKRISNLAKFLNKKYNKSTFLSYLSIGTGTFNDSNSNGIIDNFEFNSTGFENEINLFYKRLNSSKSNYLNNSLFGFIVMNLFDNPKNDFGGYQFFNKNEYHLGIITTNSIDGVDSYLSGNISYKKNILDYIFN